MRTKQECQPGDFNPYARQRESALQRSWCQEGHRGQHDDPSGYQQENGYEFDNPYFISTVVWTDR
jgi:hypothetical protein